MALSGVISTLGGWLVVSGDGFLCLQHGGGVSCWPPVGGRWGRGPAWSSAQHAPPHPAHSNPGSPPGPLPCRSSGTTRWVCSLPRQHLRLVWPGAHGDLGSRTPQVEVTHRKALLPAPKSTTRCPAQREGPPRLSPGPQHGCPWPVPPLSLSASVELGKGFLLVFPPCHLFLENKPYN